MTDVVMENLNPVFKTPIIVDFRFHTTQRLKFIMVDFNQNRGNESPVIGELQTTLLELIKAKHTRLEADLSLRG